MKNYLAPDVSGTKVNNLEVKWRSGGKKPARVSTELRKIGRGIYLENTMVFHEVKEDLNN